MPLISLTAAQRSTFLTHVSYSDPSSRDATFRHTPVSEAEGKMLGCGCGNAGRSREGRWREMAIFRELIFCFICEFWRLGRSGLERERERGVQMRGPVSGVVPGGCVHA